LPLFFVKIEATILRRGEKVFLSVFLEQVSVFLEEVGFFEGEDSPFMIFVLFYSETQIS
jgi:hypothetical protein